MKIVVLAGGLSPERNVSLSSGSMVCRALRQRGHEVAIVDLFFGTEGRDVSEPAQLFDAEIPESFGKVSAQAPDLAQVKASRKICSNAHFGPGVLEVCAMADVVFLALHGVCGEDGRVQATLDMMGIPYTGSGYLSSALALDKDMTKRLVADHPDVVTPRWQTVNWQTQKPEEVVEGVELPVVVKPLDSGSSIGVYIARTRQELLDALKASCETGGRTVLEEYIAGREFSIAVMEGKTLPSVEIIPKQSFYDYANKYQPGATEEVCPAQIPAQWEQSMGKAALAVFRTLGLAVYARADFIITEDGTPYFLEINTLPGMTPTSLVPQEAAAVGISYGELCERIITASLAARKEGK